MTNSSSPKTSEISGKQKVTPLKCLTGATLSASLAVGLYALTSAIAHSFAAKPLISDNILVLKLSSLVRTLVLGLASLGTFVCGFITIGLILLAIQIVFQKKNEESENPS